MDLNAAIELTHAGRQLQAGMKREHDDFYAPVHAGAHTHFTKVGYMHTGNKKRGGIKTSNYFRRSHSGNSRTVEVHADGSYVKTSRRAMNTVRRRGMINSSGMEERKPHIQSEARKKATRSVQAEWSRFDEERGKGGRVTFTGKPKWSAKKNVKALDKAHSELTHKGFKYHGSTLRSDGNLHHAYFDNKGKQWAGISESADGNHTSGSWDSTEHGQVAPSPQTAWS